MLRRAQLTLILAALIPTVLLIAVGIVLLALSRSATVPIIGGVLVLAFCSTALTGYILGSIFVSRGVSLARVQNDFLSSVSHELRTPMTSMRMFIETLREDRVAPEERRRCLDILDREMKRLDGLVNRLIELSRIESGRHAFRPERVSVDEVVDSALVAFDAATLGEEVEVDVELEPKLVLYADRDAISQALSNLLTNAWKYGGHGAIAVRARRRGKKIDLSVLDQGPGISREDRRLIFDKFERGKNAASDKPGTGLGLAVVKAIMRAHRGAVEVESSSRGSRFVLSFPAPKSDV